MNYESGTSEETVVANFKALFQVLLVAGLRTDVRTRNPLNMKLNFEPLHQSVECLFSSLVSNNVSLVKRISSVLLN
jgi:hypothetical protein